MLQKIKQGLRTATPTLVPFSIIVIIGLFGYLGYPNSINWYLSHMGFVLMIALFLFHRIGWFVIDNQRKQNAADPKNKTVLPKPRFPAYGKSWKEWFDLVCFIDTPKRRIFNLVITVIMLAVVTALPFGRTNPPPHTNYESFLEGWSLEAPLGYSGIVIILGTPILWFLILAFHNKAIGKQRAEKLQMIYALASSNLKYPKKKTGLTPEEQRFKSYRSSIIVKQWKGLVDPEIFFIAAPIELDIDEKEPWTKLQSNLETKLPSETGWHIEFDPQGRGATIMPASYPMSVLWDGEQDSDPLTFLLGADLDNPGEFLKFTFSETSPHSATVGGTGSGKDLPHGTYIMTNRGLITNEHLTLDDILIDPEGNETKIKAFGEWVKKPIYRMHLSDGSCVDSSDTHRWVTWDRAARRSESRTRKEDKIVNAQRKGWLSEEAIARLQKEAETCDPTEHINLHELAALAGLNQPNKAIYDLGKAIGVSKEQTLMKECRYPAQIVEQKQNVLVFKEPQAVKRLHDYYLQGATAKIRANAEKLSTLVELDEVTSTDLKEALQVDWSSIKRSMVRAGIDVNHVVKEHQIFKLTVPEKTVMKESGLIKYYPRRDMCRALAQLGAEPWHDQQDLRNMPKIRTTQEIMDTLHTESGYTNHSIMVTQPVKFEEKQLSCDPYVLGAWLGDGMTRAVKNKTTSWATEDTALLEAIQNAEPSLKITQHKTPEDISPESRTYNYKIVGFRDILPKDCVVPSEIYKFGYKKTIPQEYLFASIDQRWALLQGLMDTDGHVNKSGNCEFYQSDKDLAEQVRYLIASLGMQASLRSKKASYKDEKGELIECRDAWTVSFTPFAGSQVFRLARKQSRLDESEELRRDPMLKHRFITKVEKLEEEAWMRCIAVDSPTHQFLITDQLIPTHNTSVTEAILAQAATKPMPWSDPDDPIYAQIYIIDPKGPLANRWEGRPNIKTVNGTKDIVNEDGETVTGVQAMKNLTEEYYDEMNRRGQLIDSYRVAKWLDLPDEILKNERMAPWFIVFDEYLDHTDKNSAKTDLAEIENQARAELTEKALLVARKGRSFGFHEMIIAQTANMTLLGAPLMRQLIARIIMGNMDQSTYHTFFGTTEVPLLPTTRMSEGKKKGIPGRGRIMNAPGQGISRMQAFWFGGKENSDTLDKHLPQVLPDGSTTSPTMAEADIDDYDVDDQGPTVDLSEDNVTDESINEKPVKEKKNTPKETSEEVVSADELFASPEVEEDKSEDEACYTGEDSNPTQPCANPKCDNFVCAQHKKSPDGEMWACEQCAKKHILSKVKLGSLYPFAKQKAEKAGGSISYSKNQGEITVSIRLENVEVMKIVATTEGMRGMDGSSIVETNKEIRSMITNSLR